MAPIPPMIIRMATAYLTAMLTRRLQQSPAFFRIVDRLVHEADHLPLRLQGRPVPPYIGRDPQEPTLREQAQDAWRNQIDDPGEPHDLPNPFGGGGSGGGGGSRSASGSDAGSQPHKDALAERQRQRARDSFRAAQQNADRAREQQGHRDDSSKREAGMSEMRDLLERIRRQQQQGGEGGGGSSSSS